VGLGKRIAITSSAKKKKEQITAGEKGYTKREGKGL